MSEAFIVGEVVRLSVKSTDLSGQSAEPGGITLRIKPGAGAVTNYAYGQAAEIIRDAAGIYHADIELTSAGQWAYRWELTSPNAGAAEGVIVVNKSRVI